ncbi:myocyte-specific enhancer factor 2A-like [Xyrauchen texanus]|uniref:myocyte-specific enhancer factor 2A-like n=1 Tax=Xyrauchen texanus TaxID=154827 RepID=UPI002242564D|nr:myocyte-specific enhancer factor 2A-like [Xyrauchen texanus]
MGRKKIQITRIMDERNRQVTFTKRKFGLMKKAYELSVLCDCEIALIIFNSSNKLFQYASTDMDKVLLKYTEYSEPHESRTNSDIVEVLKKKEQRGCASPDPETSYILTPHKEKKYQKINEEFDNMMRNHKIPVVLGEQSFSLPLTLPNNNPSHLSCSTDSSLDVPASLSGANILSLQRSDSTGVMDGLPSYSDVTLPNGVHSCHVANGFIGGSEGSSMERVKSQTFQVSSTMGHKPDLRVLIPPVCKDIVSPLRINNTQSSKSLSTPVVSVTTPSLPPQDLVYSAMTSSFNTDYELNSPEPSTLYSFSSPEGIASGLSRQHSQHGQPGFNTQRGTQASDPSSSSITIKTEPISLPREHAAHCIYTSIHTMQLPNSRHEVGRSPAESFSSSGSSYESSDREDQRVDFQLVTATPGQGTRISPGTEDQEDPSIKRIRTDSWVT